MMEKNTYTVIMWNIQKDFIPFGFINYNIINSRINGSSGIGGIFGILQTKYDPEQYCILF